LKYERSQICDSEIVPVQIFLKKQPSQFHVVIKDKTWVEELK